MTKTQIVEIGKNAKIELNKNGRTIAYLTLSMAYHNAYATYWMTNGNVSKHDFHDTKYYKFNREINSMVDDIKTPIMACNMLEINRQQHDNIETPNNVSCETLETEPQTEMVVVNVPCKFNYDCVGDNCNECECVHRVMGETGDDIIMDKWGIVVDYDNHKISYPNNLDLQKCSQIIGGAMEMLDECTDDISMVNEFIKNNELAYPIDSKNWYIEHMASNGDDTAYDYHGTYVNTIIEFLIESKPNKCIVCGTTVDLSKHPNYDDNVWICKPCHFEIDNMKLVTGNWEIFKSIMQTHLKPFMCDFDFSNDNQIVCIENDDSTYWAVKWGDCQMFVGDDCQYWIERTINNCNQNTKNMPDIEMEFLKSIYKMMGDK